MSFKVISVISFKEKRRECVDEMEMFNSIIRQPIRKWERSKLKFKLKMVEIRTSPFSPFLVSSLYGVESGTISQQFPYILTPNDSSKYFLQLWFWVQLDRIKSLAGKLQKLSPPERAPSSGTFIVGSCSPNHVTGSRWVQKTFDRPSNRLSIGT